MSTPARKLNTDQMNSPQKVKPGSVTNSLMPISKTVIKEDVPLDFPIFDSDGVLLANKGVVLSSQQAAMIRKKQKLLTLKNELLAALQKKRINKSETTDTATYRAKTPFGILYHLEKKLTRIFSHQDEATTLADIYSCAGQVQTVCNQWPDAAMSKIVLDDKKHYSIQHSIHTAILCDLSAKHMGWDSDKRRSLVGAALTMNLSLGEKQDMWQNQKEPLSESDREFLQQHPLKSAQMLEDIGIDDSLWLEIVKCHHESPDGSGYPRALTQDNIPKGTLIINLADMYGAKISGRKYRKAISTMDAARYFFSNKEKHHYGPLIDIFLKIIGLYPPGSIVKLNNGETAIVVKRGPRIDEPVVKSLVKSDGNVYRSPMIRKTSQPLYSIKGFTELPLDFGELDLDFLWGFVA